MCARVFDTCIGIYILHYFLEIRIAFKFCAEMAIVKFRLIKKKCRSYTALSRDPEAIRGKERESAEIYIIVMIRSLLPRHITVPFANGLPLLISSPLAREEHSFARSLALFLSSSAINPKRVTFTDTPKGGNKRFVAAARQEPP